VSLYKTIRTPLVVVGLVVAVACGTDRTGPVFPELEIVTQTLADATVGEPYAGSVQAAGGDGAYQWDVTQGVLPPGLALQVDDLAADNLLISGLPETEGSFTFTVRVRSGDGQSDTTSLTLVVQAPPDPLVILTVAVPPALADGPYDVRLRSEGGAGPAAEWRLASGRLPAGLELTDAGRIRGTPAALDTARFTVEVRRGGASTTRAYMLAVVPNQRDRFNITLFPVVEVPEGVRPHLATAVADWERAITTNLPPVTIPATFMTGGACGGFGSHTNGTSVDDLLIIVNITPIDGPGGVLGRAGPCGVRTGSELPFVGVLTLDEADLLPLVGNQTLTHIISHEIAHVLGFGTLWDRMELITGEGGANPRFTGELAVAEYQALGGDGTVPVENLGGEGTRDGHWRQVTFGNERMTGFSAPAGVFQPLSRVSLASLADLGYTVSLDAADEYSLGRALVAPDGHHLHDLGWDEILREPIRVLDPAGAWEGAEW
jgi:hypothetical protein